MSDPSAKLTATLSIDLDNLWAYERVAGRSDWKSCPSYFSIVTPRIRAVLMELGLPLTVFVVGRDLESRFDREAAESFRDLSAVEYANHSWDHLAWLHRLEGRELREQIERSHEKIHQDFGIEPIGFRGPGFSCPPAVMDVLADLRYRYDASLFPTSLAPLSRLVFRWRTRGSEAADGHLDELYGGWRSAFRPNQPFQHESGPKGFWEIPVTTCPLTRTPIHFSYLQALASISQAAAKTYFRMALSLCRVRGIVPSLLLHPPDFLGGDDGIGLNHLPGMRQTHERKLRFMRWALQYLHDRFEVVTMKDLVDRTSNPHLHTAPSPASVGEGMDGRRGRGVQATESMESTG